MLLSYFKYVCDITKRMQMGCEFGGFLELHSCILPNLSIIRQQACRILLEVTF